MLYCSLSWTGQIETTVSASDKDTPAMAVSSAYCCGERIAASVSRLIGLIKHSSGGNKTHFLFFCDGCLQNNIYLQFIRL